MAFNKLVRIFAFFGFTSLVLFSFQNCGMSDCNTNGMCSEILDSGATYLSSKDPLENSDQDFQEIEEELPAETSAYDCEAGEYGISNYDWSYYRQNTENPWINPGGTFFINKKDLFTADKVQYFTFPAARFGDVQQVACDQTIPVVNAKVKQPYWTCKGGPVVFECRNGKFRFINNTCDCKSNPPPASPKATPKPTPRQMGGRNK